MGNLEQELKELIIDCLDLEDVTPEDIGTDMALFVDGLGLDSIDALELGLNIQKKYNVKLDANSEDTHKNFASVATLRDFIIANTAS